MSQADYYF